MNEKRNIIFLIVAIVIFIAALIFAIWSNTKSTDETNEIIEQNLVEDEESHTKDLNVSYQDFSVLDSEGNEVKLSDYEDKAIMILFWNSESAESVEMLNRINELYETYSEKIDFMAIDTINEDVTSILGNISVPVYYDSEGNAVENYGITDLPAMIYINSSKEIVNSKTGLTTRDALEANLDILSENY